MSDIAIRVEKLSKKYRIGAKQEGYRTLRDTLTGALVSPFHRARRLLGGQPYGASELDETIWALKDISFEIKRGEVVGIIGRNGAGKTTLLKVLSRITEPTEGQAEIYGRVGSLLEVGTGFHPELTGRENIYLNGAILGMKKAEIAQKFDEIVAFAEIEKFIDTPVKHYSSGMYVRLAFAVAAHLEPEILLVDEVLAVGDAAFQRKCLGKMGDVAKEGRTVLFVSHNMTAVRTLCTRALWLSDGCLEDNGQSNEVVSTYLKTLSNTVLKRKWENAKIAPGNDQVRLLQIGVSAAEGHFSDEITVDVPINIEVEFYNSTQDCCLNFSLVIYTIEDICVLNSVSKPQSFAPGIVRGVCHIPAKLLNASTYRVRLLIVKDTNVSLFDQDYLLTFDVHDIERNGSWYGKWIGAVRPQLKWTLEMIKTKLDK